MSVNKSYLELASEAANELVKKGYLRMPVNPKTMSIEEQNYTAIHTYGWAVLELYRELKDVAKKAYHTPKKPRRAPTVAAKSTPSLPAGPQKSVSARA